MDILLQFLFGDGVATFSYIASAVGAGLGALGGLFSGIGQSRRAREQRALQEKYLKKQISELGGQTAYDQSELYKKLGIGTGQDQLHQFQRGGDLNIASLDPSAYGELGQRADIGAANQQTLEGLSRRAEAGILPEEQYQAQQLIDQQRRQGRTAQDTITANAVAAGADPARAGLLQRLTAAQSGAGSAANAALGLQASASARQGQALGQLGQAAQNVFGQGAAVAGAQDARSQSIFGAQNLANQSNIARERQQLDANTNLQNQLVQQNEAGRSGAYTQATDSANRIRQQLASAYGSQASGAGTRATGYENQAGASFGGAAQSAGNFGGALTAGFTPYQSGQNAGQTPFQVQGQTIRNQQPYRVKRSKSLSGPAESYNYGGANY